MRLSNRSTWIGAPVSLLVLAAQRVPADNGRLWLQVALPVRPNGTRGWIPADNFQLTRLHWRLTISTEQRTVSVFRYGRLWRRFSAVVGAPATPTPHGQFAIYEAVPQPNPRGFDGAWALHTSAFSNVLKGFDGGPGRVAIHGRGGASLRAPLGSALSHGCIRISNANLLLLTRFAVPGTPVRII